MKLIMCSALLASFFSLTFNLPQREATHAEDRQIIFSGKVLEVGPSPGFGSGGVTAYQLVKYQVLEVCKGSYRGQEIIADHVILEANELSDLKVGDKVCVGVVKAKEIHPRFNDETIRKTTDVVETYYIVHDIFIRNCQCSGAASH